MGYTWYISIIFLYISYLEYISTPICFYASGSDRVVGASKSSAGHAAPEQPTMVSVCLISSTSSWIPKPAARHAGDIPMCVFAALSPPWPRGRHLWMCSVPHSKHRHIGVSESSRASLLITKQVKLSGPPDRASACNKVPFWTSSLPLSQAKKNIPNLNARPQGLSRCRALPN